MEEERIACSTGTATQTHTKNMSEANESGQYLHTGKWEAILALDAETG
jgi:hypothetical protein